MNKSLQKQLEEIGLTLGDKNIPICPGPGILVMDDVKPLDNEMHCEFGCSIPVRFNTSEGWKTMQPGKTYDENLNEIESVLKPTESSHNEVEEVNGPWMLENDDEGLKCN